MKISKLLFFTIFSEIHSLLYFAIWTTNNRQFQCDLKKNLFFTPFDCHLTCVLNISLIFKIMKKYLIIISQFFETTYSKNPPLSTTPMPSKSPRAHSRGSPGLPAGWRSGVSAKNRTPEAFESLIYLFNPLYQTRGAVGWSDTPSHASHTSHRRPVT